MSFMNNLSSFKKLSESNKYINLRDRLFRTDSLIQAGKTPLRIIYEDVESKGMVQLRHYPALDGYPTIHKTPIVIVPPLAVNTLIYDLFEDRSFVRYLLEQGFSVYMIDWGSPSRAHKHYNFEQYVLKFMPNLLKEVRQHSGLQQLSLHGWSLAGVFVLLYAAATKDPDIKNLIVLGAPIDTHKSGPIGAQVQKANRGLHWLEKRTGLSIHKLPSTLLHTKGWTNALGYALLDINGTLNSYTSMLRNLDDRAAIESHATNGAFLNHMVDYPGSINKEMLLNVWVENTLSKGEIKIKGKTVYLKDVTPPIFIGAGRSDTMVTAAAQEPLAELVGSHDVTFSLLPGGHVSMIASKAAEQEAWPKIAAWLAKHSD
ncbi:MAG: alpha/beta fold hydrolase [Aquirhabdus sp.]